MFDGTLQPATKRKTLPFISYFLVFVLAFVLFGYWQWHYSFGDPDAFYHAKLAEFLSRGIILKDLPWMHFSTLRDNFADHHFLYHVALAPFLFLGNPLYGIKVATITFSATAVLTLYWYLRRQGNTWSWLLPIFLLISSAWAFRFGLVKANSLSLVLLFVLLVCLQQRWRWRLFLTQFLYVWLYGGWILGWGVAGLWWLIQTLWPAKGLDWRQRWNRQQSATLLVLVIGATLAGVVLHPNWPANFWLYWQQIVQIGLFDQADSLNAGAEWYPLNIIQLVTFHLYALPLLVGALAVSIFYSNRWQPRQWLHLTLAVIFFIFTYRSRRYVELSVPFALVAAIDIFHQTFPGQSLKTIWNKIIALGGRVGAVLRIYIFLFIIVFAPLSLLIAARDLFITRTMLAGSGFPLEGLRPEMEWLAKNAPAGERIFHTHWDWWPMLFYYNDRNYYLVGLDPTFMHNYDPELYRLYQDITAGKVIDDLHTIIRQRFGTNYVLVGRENKALDDLISINPNFQLAFQGYSARIYALRP